MGEKGFKDIMKIASDEKAIEYVVEGATLECSKGITSSKLATPGRKRICIGNRLQANIKDSKPNKNIMPFGKCRRGKKKPCTPKISMQWIGGKSDVIVDGAPALLATSKLVCQFGGTICIKDSGQSTRRCLDNKSTGSLLMVGAGALAPGINIKDAQVSNSALVVAAATMKAANNISKLHNSKGANSTKSSQQTTDKAELLPTSGYELEYNPGKWNDGARTQYSTNCFAYSLDLQFNPITGEKFPAHPIWDGPTSRGQGLSPGKLSGLERTPESFISVVAEDLKVLGWDFVPIGETERAPQYAYKVALVIRTGVDYHWYRQNPDGTWSHKPGALGVTDLDFSGQLIINPRLSDLSNYEFVGYFYIRILPDNPYRSKMVTFTIPK